MADKFVSIDVAEVKNKDGDIKKRIQVRKRMFVNAYKQPDDKRPDYKSDDKEGYSEIAGWSATGTYEDKKSGVMKTYDAIDVTIYMDVDELKEALKKYEEG
jgi:hypothetical protein